LARINGMAGAVSEPLEKTDTVDLHHCFSPTEDNVCGLFVSDFAVDQSPRSHIRVPSASPIDLSVLRRVVPGPTKRPLCLLLRAVPLRRR
jgi:hypothetical protein